MRRRSIDDLHRIVFAKRNGFFCRGVRQAEKNDVCRIDLLPSGIRILAELLRKRMNADILPIAQTFKNFQSGGALFAVYKNIYHCIALNYL